jgi:hypothetical protein
MNVVDNKADVNAKTRNCCLIPTGRSYLLPFSNRAIKVTTSSPVIGIIKNSGTYQYIVIANVNKMKAPIGSQKNLLQTILFLMLAYRNTGAESNPNRKTHE